MNSLHRKYALGLFGATSVLLSSAVSAHGFMDFPKARQAICQAQGGYWWPDDGSNIPNLACRAAFLDSGHFQFVQEHEFSTNTADYNNLEAVKANIPNGTLCSAGDPNKSGMSVVSPHWQRTVVEPNAQNKLAISFRATTPHNPSFWQFFLSKPNYDGDTSPLTWNDLELINEFGNIDFVVDPEGKRFYKMEIDIPQGREGDAVLYTRWQRFDVAGEGFYNCSDITITSTGTPPEWVSSGYFLKQGQDAKAGDSVWFRTFDQSGNELISHNLNVTSTNASTWQAELALYLNSNYGNKVNIGVKQPDGSIAFDANALLANEVFLPHAAYTSNLSVVKGGDNTAPTVNPISNQSIAENSQATVHAHAFDDQNDPLTFIWSIPAPLSFSGEGDTISISTPEVTADQTFQAELNVTDGKASTTVSFSITVQDSTNNQYPAWNSTTTYVAGDRVTHQQKVYEAKWWTQGEEPGASDVWKAI
ncbi:lytic polysaccharide monooxygenase [Pseudoalteromonas piscicida]|uniref:lytic polysaccharide monooxygenase n=1 Tax=Pseudoalteromonas piscicida TaxID=43662 RepID=UPI003C7DA483